MDCVLIQFLLLSALTGDRNYKSFYFFSFFSALVDGVEERATLVLTCADEQTMERVFNHVIMY